MFDLELKSGFPFVGKKPIIIKQTLLQVVWGGVVAGAKLTATGICLTTGVVAGGVAVMAVVRHRRRKNKRTEGKLRPLDSLVASGNEYETSLRDCADGETHDVVVEEDEVVEMPAAEGGGVERLPAVRRMRKKKIVHTPYQGGYIHGAYLGDVVARARNIYNNGPSDQYHRALARAYMVRIMTEHKVRPAHINNHIDLMVCAVFHKTSVQYAADDMWDAMMEQQSLTRPLLGWF